jgi:DNA repair protein RadA/Sms
MAKSATTYMCDSCGTQSPVQMGRCPGCGEWGTMQRTASSAVATPQRSRRSAHISTLDEVDEAALLRRPSGEAEVDRVLGGGWVAGSALLLAGEPGIGKSTLLLQLAHHAVADGRTLLYVAGEESLAQVKLRAERLGVGGGMQLTRETDARVLADHLVTEAPELVIVDSVQTLTADDQGTPGSLTQVRDGTALLTQAAKLAGSTLVLIGHVTKQGSIAGPKVIEHMVDATLALESASGFRVLRAIKNRFGPAGEMGVFEMSGEGMRAVPNPSEAFLAERPLGVAGSVVVAALEGQRPLLLEVQALAAKSPYASPRRVVQGLDQRRVDVALAVLERRIELPLGGLDVFVNVAGGLRLTDPGTDLAVALAVYSAVTNRPLPKGTAVVGEVGLAGEVRSVAQLARRVQEARRADFDTVITPRSTEVATIGVATLAEALTHAWSGS